MAVPGLTLAKQSGLVLGSGSYRYECFHDWLTPPPGMAFGDTHGLAQDARGNIYLAHTVHANSKVKDAVCVYDKNGAFLRSWGSRFAGGAHGLDIRREGTTEYLYHCDTQSRQIVKTTLDGTVVWERGVPQEPGVYDSQHAFVPTNVAFHPNGDLFVGDGYGSSHIHLYSKNGDYKKHLCGPGKGQGEVNCPHGLWVDNRGSNPLLAVADRSNRRIQYLDLDGKHVKFVTDGMRLPCHFSIHDGVMLMPDLQSVVTLVDPLGQVIAHLGDGDPSSLRGHPRTDFIPGKFIHPHDAIFLHNGDILVAEWVPIGRVTLLKRLPNG